MMKVVTILFGSLLALGANVGVAAAKEAWPATDEPTAERTGQETGEAADQAAREAAAAAADAREAETLQSSNRCPLGSVICAPRTIVNSFSGLCLNVLNFSQHNGANVVQATNCAIASSKWYVVGSVEFVVSALHSGQCLNVLNSAQHNGANVVQAQDCTSANSRWRINHVGWQGGRKLFNLKAQHSDQCLNVLNWGLFNGANVVQAQDCSLPTSKWLIQGE